MKKSRKNSARPELPHTVLATLPTPTRWRRFACMMYEAVLLFGVVFLASYLFDTLTQSRSGMTLRHARQVLLFVAIGAYFILCWRKRGQTLPMKTWNIRLVDRDGRTPRPSRLLLRYILIWPLPLVAAMIVRAASHATGYGSVDLFIVVAPFTIFLWTWIDNDRQFLHDRLLGTRLINIEDTNREPVETLV
ncbi:RDD family protein [Candidimonas nitroreducens]|uniref:RDD family protein n=1 Tax=Candidimonas nitroreducens TaxID=683354 RepID=A0A225M961_9BURK|nr:RDD family protein [Candidimonas nitroreducens]OWT57656.1 RDD family protein [Candidimonas nitroreducens]